MQNRPALKPLQENTVNIGNKNSELTQKEVVKVEKEVVRTQEENQLTEVKN